jgi:hypothetical protein
MKRNPNPVGDGAAGASTSQAAFDARAYVWRISEQAPQGEWVHKGKGRPRGSPHAADEPFGRDANWATSSWDLLTGVTVVETSGAKQDELLNEFFARGGHASQ